MNLTTTLLIVLAFIGITAAQLDAKKADEAEVCPRKPHLVGSRRCKRACTKDSQCKGKRKKCVCDDVCGMTCLNPKGKCPSPDIVNGRARVMGRNKLGAVAKYSCTRGYKLQGVETRICNGDREWSGTAPQCVPVSSGGGRELRDPVSNLQGTESQSRDKLANGAVYKQCPEPPSIPFADHNAPKKTRFTTNFEVEYACRSPYVSEGITKAVCMSSGLWAGPLMQCKEDACPDLGELTNGVRYGDSLKIGSKVDYECNVGYRLIGSPTLTCRRGQVWDKPKPVCQLTASNTCNKPKVPRHGRKIGRSYVVGGAVTILCDTGYKITGTAKRVCQADGKWSGVEPDCLPVDCGKPGPLWNGIIEGYKYTYGSLIRYRCLEGSTFQGLTITSTCLENGKWSFPVPKCLKKCNKPEIPYADLFMGSQPAPASITHGEDIRVQCNDGLIPTSSTPPTCNNGTWSNLPTCVQGGCDHRPQEIANGLALYRGTRYGDRVRYTCNAGYRLKGDRYLICEGGEWKGAMPECEAVYCPHPGDLTNGKILLVGDIGKYEYRPYVRKAGQGEKIEYDCGDGYRREGPSAATCIDGMWSPESKPKCIDSQHPVLPDTQDLFTT